jgi:hypothetical protein
MINIHNPVQFMAELKAIQMHLESLYAAHREGFHKLLDKGM